MRRSIKDEGGGGRGGKREKRGERKKYTESGQCLNLKSKREKEKRLNSFQFNLKCLKLQ